MAIFKKSIIIIVCMILALSPLLYCGDFSYADDSWHDISELSGDDYKKYIVGGIKAGLNYFGYKETFSYDISKAIWNYSYNTWDRIAKKGGYSGVEELNSKIKYRIDSDYKLHFKVTMSGLQFINDLLGEIVDYYDLTQGYTKEIYSGKYFEDDNGIGCYVFVITDQTSSYSTDRPILDFNSNVYWGTPYRFSGKAYYNSNNEGLNTYTLNYNNNSITYHMKVYKDPNGSKDVAGFSLNTGWPIPSGKNGYIYLGPDNPTSYQSVNGWVCITTNQSFSRYYLGTFLEYYSKNSPTSVYCQLYSEQGLQNLPVNNQSVTGNYTPNNNTANGDKDINTGDGNVDDFLENDDPQIVVDDDNGLPDTPPTDPYVPNPTGGNEDENGNFNWQMPDINVDWDLGDFTHIFPFSIPYDIIELFDFVDAEPVTPAIYQEVDFGAFNYTIDFDLSYFDEFMEYVRAMELFLYTLTLFIATRGIFKIY